MVSNLTSLKDLKVLQYQIPAYGLTPNTSIQHKPLLIYRSAFSPDTTSASQIEQHMSGVGVVVPQWRYTMYSTSHFHSTSHEVLGIVNGRARLCFGHEDNPGKVEEILSKGDVIIMPAGVSHRLLDDIEAGFEMVRSILEIPSFLINAHASPESLNRLAVIRKDMTGICVMERKEKKRRLKTSRAYRGLRRIPYTAVTGPC